MHRNCFTGFGASIVLIATTLFPSLALADSGERWVVCAEGASSAGCDLVGDEAIQQAVDLAADGAIISVRAGRYVPRSYRDVSFDEHIIRGYVLVRGKHLTLAGEEGVILDGSEGALASAIVVKNGGLTLRDMTLQGFRVLSPDDEIYDGHGVFVIQSTASLTNVNFRSIEKMSLSIRGRSTVDATHIRILDGHVGVWIEEDAELRISDCVMRNNDSAGVAAYASAVVTIERCVFEENLDDGVYAAESSAITVRDSLFIRNVPYAIRGIDASKLHTWDSFFHANAASYNAGETGTVEISDGIFIMDGDQ